MDLREALDVLVVDRSWNLPKADRVYSIARQHALERDDREAVKGAHGRRSGRTDSGEVRVGGMTLARADTFEAARQYLSGIGVHGYPAYDGYNTGSGPNEVHDGDLLSPPPY